ncbi:MAG: tetratricopeptide repeat protein, partial [Crocinitomicaceae bacterium]
MSQKETLLFRLVELMLEKQQTFLLLDELYEDEVISPFVRNIQIDSPYQQLIFEGVLSQFSQDEELIVMVTVEQYFHNLLAKILQKDKRYETPQSLIELVKSNQLQGINASVSAYLSLDVESGRFDRITELIDLSEEDNSMLEICTLPLVNSLLIHGVDQTINVILSNPTESDWSMLLNIDSSLSSLQLNELRIQFLHALMPENPMDSKNSLLLGLKANTLFDVTESQHFLQKINTDSSILQNDHNLLFQLGKLEMKLGNMEKSLEHHQNCLEKRLQLYGEHNSLVAVSINNIGIIYDMLGDPIKSETYFKKSFEIRSKILPNDHPDIANAFNNIALVFRQKFEFNESLNNFSKSLEIKLKCFGKNHPEIARSYGNIGLLWLDNGDLNKALEYLQLGLDILLKTMGEEHPDVSIALTNIGIVNYNLRQYDRALDFFQKSLAIDLKNYGEGHLNL